MQFNGYAKLSVRPEGHQLPRDTSLRHTNYATCVTLSIMRVRQCNLLLIFNTIICAILLATSSLQTNVISNRLCLNEPCLFRDPRRYVIYPYYSLVV